MMGEVAKKACQPEKTYRVPASLNEAVRDANTLGGLQFAAGWKRAAIVRAYCKKDAGHGGNTDNSQRLSLTKFSELGIVGLTSFRAVQRYYDAWDATGLPEPEPGKSVKIPQLAEFPKTVAAKTEPKPVEHGEDGSWLNKDTLWVGVESLATNLAEYEIPLDGSREDSIKKLKNLQSAVRIAIKRMENAQ